MRRRERGPTQSHGLPSRRVRSVPSVSLAKRSRCERGRGGRRSLPLAVTRTPPHEWVLAGLPLPHAGTSHAAGERAEASARVHAVPSAADAGSRGAMGTCPHPQGDRHPRAGPRGIAAGAKPPVPPEAKTKPRRKDPGSRPRTLRNPARSRHARGRDPRPVRRPRCPFSPQAAASERSLLAAAPGPTGAQLSSRQSRGSLNHGAPGRCRCRRFSPCSTLRIRLGSRSCSCRGAAAGTHTMQVHRAPPAARRLAPSGVGRPGPAPRPMGSEPRGEGGT